MLLILLRRTALDYQYAGPDPTTTPPTPSGLSAKRVLRGGGGGVGALNAVVLKGPSAQNIVDAIVTSPAVKQQRVAPPSGGPPPGSDRRRALTAA